MKAKPPAKRAKPDLSVATVLDRRDWSPVDVLLDIAMQAQTEGDIATVERVATKLLPYVSPKLQGPTGAAGKGPITLHVHTGVPKPEPTPVSEQ